MVQAINSSSPDGYDPFVRAMMRFSERVKRAERQLMQVPQIAWPVSDAQDKAEADDGLPIISRLYAEPLAPLRDRDEVALNDVFQTEHIEDAVNDVQNRLSHLHPEPCWEDDPYDFLHGYV
ncbi:MAG: hypothetical protein AAFZ80_01430 [Cyanobacteria bacterium P01_A01_bin.105]